MSAIGTKRTLAGALKNLCLNSLSGHFQCASLWLVRCVCPEPEADMRRREFVTLVGGAAVSWSITSHAQQSDKTRLIAS